MGAICIELMAIGRVACGGGMNVFPITKATVPSAKTASSGAVDDEEHGGGGGAA